MRNLILITFLSISFSSFNQNINDSLLIHYTFDGNAEDQSGNNHHGNVNATLTDDRFGNPNSAYSFNGVNEFIDLPNKLSLKPDLSVTVSFWVKFNEIAGDQTTVFTSDFATDNHTGVFVSTNSSGLFGVGFGDNTGNTSPLNRRSKLGETFLQKDEWYHLTAVVRGANDMDLYIDCINDGGYYTGSGGQIGYSSANGSIGRKDSYYQGPASYFYGVLDDFKYWSRDLSEEEILSMCRSVGGVEVNENSTYEFEFTLFPNPTNNILNIDTDFDKAFEVKIFSYEGKEIECFQENEKTIDVSSLQAGMYMVKVLAKYGTFEKTLKFIKD